MLFDVGLNSELVKNTVNASNSLSALKRRCGIATQKNGLHAASCGLETGREQQALRTDYSTSFNTTTNMQVSHWPSQLLHMPSVCAPLIPAMLSLTEEPRPSPRAPSRTCRAVPPEWLAPRHPNRRPHKNLYVLKSYGSVTTRPTLTSQPPVSSERCIRCEYEEPEKGARRKTKL